MVKTWQESAVVYGTEDILTSLCNSVTRVLTAATQCPIHYSGMVQRITKTCLKPDIGCFVLFDGGFTGLVVLNFAAPTAMEIYETYMLSMGMPKEELAKKMLDFKAGRKPATIMHQLAKGYTDEQLEQLAAYFAALKK